MSRKRVSKVVKQERVSVTLHFVRGTSDDTAIAKIEEWAKGDRSYNLKQILLNRLDNVRGLDKGPDVKASVESIAESLTWLQDAFAKFPEMFQDMLSKVAINASHTEGAQTNNRKTPSRREERMKGNEWE